MSTPSNPSPPSPSSPSSSTSSMRKRTPPPSETAAHLPPPRKGSGMRSVAPPGSKTNLSTHIYVLVVLVALMGAYYSWRLVQYKTAVGGWWSLMLGKRPVEMQMQHGAPVAAGTGGVGGQQESQPNTNWNGWRGSKPVKANTGEDSVEGHIQGLAAALGMPTNELASAIASAVRAYVPPASLSSVAAKETGEAVRVLMQEPSEGEAQAVPVANGARKKDTSGRVVDSFVTGMEAMVGMDEP